jgi:hypothetical protein
MFGCWGWGWGKEGVIERKTTVPSTIRFGKVKYSVQMQMFFFGLQISIDSIGIDPSIHGRFFPALDILRSRRSETSPSR